MNLLERVQKREETMKATETLFGDAQTRDQKQMLEKLPDLASSIRQQFKIEKRQSMKLEKLVSVLQTQRSWGSAKDIEMLLDKLVQAVPQWCCKQQIGKTQVFKIVNMELNLISEVFPKLKNLEA
jgi:folylpolyglutamate synthase/dihydropteroate synthase